MSSPEALDFDNLGADHAISLYLAKVAAMNDNPTTDAMFEIAALAVNIVPVLADEIEALRKRLAAKQPELTERQRVAVDELIELAKHHGVDDRVEFDHVVEYLPEARPGRGHDIRIHYADGDHAVGAYFDVYGHGTRHIGAVDWTHGEMDDGAHECPICTGEERPVVDVQLPDEEQTDGE